jgi:hypothetical protein
MDLKQSDVLVMLVTLSRINLHVQVRCSLFFCLNKNEFGCSAETKNNLFFCLNKNEFVFFPKCKMKTVSLLSLVNLRNEWHTCKRKFML